MLEMLTAAGALWAVLIQTPPPPAAAAAGRSVNSPVVLTGCLTASTEDKDPRFMLINASPAPAGGKGAQPRYS